MAIGPDPLSLSRREVGGVVLALFALTLVFTYPLSRDLGGSLLAIGPDGELFMWTLAWDVYAFFSQPLSLFDANILHPRQHTLAYSENLIGSAFFAAPVLWLTDNPVVAVNVVALLSNVLCGFGAYVLARRLGIGRAGSMLAALVFTFSPPRFFRIGQLHLGPVQWIPFGLAFLHGYLTHERRRDLRLAIVCFSMQALTSGHGAAFMVVAYAALLGWRLLAGDAIAPLRRLKDVGVTGVLLLVPSVLVYLPYRWAQQDVGLRRSLENWAVTPESFVASPTHLHQWLWSLVSDWRILDTASAFLFPGILPLALAAVALLWRGRGEWRFDTAAFYGLLVLLGAWLSVGPPLGIWPLVYDWPGLSFVRVPSRFSVLAILGLAILAGIGFDRLTRGRGPRQILAAASVTGFLLLGEFAAFPMAVERVSAEIPAADRWLATRPTPFVVAEVPVIDYARRQVGFVRHSMAHWQKTVHGYTGILPPEHERLYEQMRGFPDPTSIDALRRFGVTYIVVHAELYPPGEWDLVRERLRQHAAALELVHDAAPGFVYLLR